MNWNLQSVSSGAAQRAFSHLNELEGIAARRDEHIGHRETLNILRALFYVEDLK